MPVNCTPLLKEAGMRRESVVRPIAWMMIATALNSLATFGREALSAAYFGASVQTDAFNVGVAITGFALLILSPLSDVFVPVYVDYLARDRHEDVQYILNAVGTFLLVLLGVSAVVLFAFADPLVGLYASGFDVEGRRLTVDLLRILIPFAVFSGLATYSILILTARKDFVWIGLAPVVGTVAAIGILWRLAPSLGIHALAWGFVGGGAVEILVLGWGLRQQKIRFRPTLRVRESLGLLGKLSLFMLAIRYVGQISEIVDRNMLSHLSAGSIAALAFARNIYSVPFQVFTLGITRVVITYFSWDAAHEDADGLKRNLSLSIRIGAFFMLPATVGLILLRNPVIQVLYERGEFTAADTQATATMLAWFALGLFAHAVLFITIRYFLSRKAVGRFAFITVLYVGCRVVFNLLFIKPLDHAAIACSTALAGAMAAAVALLLIRRELGALGGGYIACTCLKASAAAFVMGGIVYLGGRSPFIQMLPSYGQLGSLVAGGALVYLLAAYLIRLEELRLLIDLVRDRIKALMKGAG